MGQQGTVVQEPPIVQERVDAAEGPPATAPLPTRRLGKTELEVPILGLGSAPGGMGLPDGEAIDLLHRAIDRGVTYLDTAPGYGRAHLQLREVLAERRDEVIVATKTPVNTAREALDSLKQSLRDLGTDRVDIAFIHNLGPRDAEQVLGTHGALAGLREAKRSGMARFIGFTSHSRPAQSARALAEHDVDVIMVPVNYGDQHTYGFERQVLPVAHAHDVGIAAMKVYGGATDMKYDAPKPAALTAKGPVDHEPAMRWALEQAGVAIAVIGMFIHTELEQNVRWAHRMRPLTADERRMLDHEGKALAESWGERFGSP